MTDTNKQLATLKKRKGWSNARLAEWLDCSEASVKAYLRTPDTDGYRNLPEKQLELAELKDPQLKKK